MKGRKIYVFKKKKETERKPEKMRIAKERETEKDGELWKREGLMEEKGKSAL